MAFAKSSEPVMQALVPLSAVTHVDRDRVGSKAANLAALANAGFPVPDGFVLTTVAFERFLSSTGLGVDTDPAAVAAAPLPTEVAEALRAALAMLGDGPLAVRSSAVAEDRAEASFAGQYETILDVHGYTALDLRQLPTLDMLVELQKALPHRLSLDTLANATLGVEKTAEGMQAIRWFREGRMMEIAEYCCYDVKITRLVHEFGARHRQLYYKDRFGKKLVVPVGWAV